MIIGYLPNSDSLQIAILSRIFSKTTNSYKYLFFLALLDILESRNFDNQEPIEFKEIAIEMLANAWYPHIYFKLSFGVQDQIGNKLDSLNLDFENFQHSNKENLKKVISNCSLDGVINGNGLLRFVPFRLIRPFFENETRRMKDYDVDPKITILADQHFNERKPIYKFNSLNYQDCDSVILHPEWIEYFKKNYPIVRGWISWEWLSYMQRRNPNTPAITNKIFSPQKRDSLSYQIQYWRTIVNNVEIKCIYTNALLDRQRLSLDHYLPWSFVTHDRLWNLIPTSKSVNSSKSNNIPSTDLYFNRFVEIQHLGLIVSSQNFSENIWNKFIESYLLDLKITDKNNLLNLDILKKAYTDNILPLINLAINQGFSANWYFNHIENIKTMNDKDRKQL